MLGLLYFVPHVSASSWWSEEPAGPPGSGVPSPAGPPCQSPAHGQLTVGLRVERSKGRGKPQRNGYQRGEILFDPLRKGSSSEAREEAQAELCGGLF